MHSKLEIKCDGQLASYPNAVETGQFILVFILEVSFYPLASSSIFLLLWKCGSVIIVIDYCHNF